MDNANIFAQLQALSTLSEQTTIITLRKQLNDMVAWFKNREAYLEEVTIFAEVIRNLKVQTLLDCDSFMIQDDFNLLELPEEFAHDSLGLCKGSDYCIFQGRYVYPVKDVHGDVMGLCGYDKFSDMKYLDSTNFGYKAKTYSCWGMEKLPEYYRNNKPVFFVEGIVCALYIRQCGMQSLAMLGSNASPYIMEIMRRFGPRAIVVCDSDEAGTKCRERLRRKVPMVRCVQSHIAKDVDDSREVDSNFIVELLKLQNPFYNSDLFS
jgi:DNA primase